jgi:hypothetical protein
MVDQNTKKQRISNSTMTVMVIIAFLFDLLEIALLLIWGIGLVLNRLVVFIKWWIFWFWFGAKDVPFAKLDSKKSVQRLAIMAITVLIGIIPGLGALPEFTVGIIALCLLVKAEDKIGVSTNQIDSVVNKERTRRRSAKKEGGQRSTSPSSAENLNEAYGTT